MAYCQKCGKQVGANDRFCKICGNKIPHSAGDDELAAPQRRNTVAKYVTQSCGYCDGTGEVNVGELVPVYQTCPVCKGDGSIQVPDNYVSCPICDGTGKQNVGEIIPREGRCRKCRGKGWAPPPPMYR